MLQSAEGAAPVTGWQVAPAPPDLVRTPAGLGGLEWLPARVPGTVAGALRDAGHWTYGDQRDLDADDWWFRASLPDTSCADGEEVTLRIGGIATLAEVFLDGELLLESGSMFAQHQIVLRRGGRAGAELAIRCRALTPVLDVPRRPRARWHSPVAAGGLRHHRTMLLGRAPGLAPSPAAVGPWRAVTIERRHHVAFRAVHLRCRVSGGDGRLKVAVQLGQLGRAQVRSVVAQLTGPSGAHDAPLVVSEAADGLIGVGEIIVPQVALWWPHTHGEPTLHQVRLVAASDAGTSVVEAGPVGFRDLAAGPPGHDLGRDGLDLRVNGVRIFVRGAVWTPLDVVGLAPSKASLRSSLLRARDAGMNMLRVVGLGTYESADFHDLCDELGILLWQDFMFANFDYPVADDAFRLGVEAEARSVMADLAWRPSLAVLCGNSEVSQQAAMLGLAAGSSHDELFGELLPKLVREAEVEAPYIASSPCGGDLPFRTDQGIANYFGVGGYRRPMTDARLANVRFAAECLAFSNLPDDPALCDVAVPRDAGAAWDFAEVRDHYAGLLHGVDVDSLRTHDRAQYLELGRATSGEVMAEVFGEWRRDASPCRGALVLWLNDLVPGAGLGVVDHLGVPKVAYRHLARVLSTVSVWITDEGLNGLDVHVANDRPEPLRARLRVALYREWETLVEEVREDLVVAGRATIRRGVEEMIGRFVDVSYAYRFGPPVARVVVASLERDLPAGGTDLVSQAFSFPTGRPATADVPGELGLRARGRMEGDDLVVTVQSRRLAYGVRLRVPGGNPSDDAFSVEPGGARSVRFRSFGVVHHPGVVSAVNLAGLVGIEMGPGRP